jgi:4-hydroxymandelate oxidase
LHISPDGELNKLNCFVYGLATAGALGAAHTLKILKEELEVSMIFTGCKDIEAIKKITLAKY